MRSAITMESPTVVDSRALVEGLVLQETCRKKFYELEPQLGICLRRCDVLPIHPKMRVPASVQWPGDSETKCS